MVCGSPKPEGKEAAKLPRPNPDMMCWNALAAQFIPTIRDRSPA